MKTIRFLLIVILLFSVGVLVHVSESLVLTSLEVGALIVIGVLVIFGVLIIHSVIVADGANRKREKYATKKIRL